MPEELSFHFPIAALSHDGDAIITAAETHPDINARLATGYVAQARSLLGTVAGDVAAMKGKKGGMGTLTQAQRSQIEQLNKWIASARRTAGLAFKGQDVKLRAEFQVGSNEPSDLGSLLARARIIVASTKQADNAPALKTKGWLDADTSAFEAVISSLAATDLTHATGKGSAKDATTQRNHDANALYDQLLTIQNAADLQWPDDSATSAGIRDEFRFRTFPPRGGGSGPPEPPPAPTPPPPPAP